MWSSWPFTRLVKQENYLLRHYLIAARRTFFFLVEQVFLPMGRCGPCIMHERGGQRAAKHFCVQIFLDLSENTHFYFMNLHFNLVKKNQTVLQENEA